MPTYCVVPVCKTNQLISKFTIPNDKKRKSVWADAIGVKKLEKYHRICEKHFQPDSIIRFTEHKDEDGNLLARIPLQRPRLKDNAVPCLFLKETDLIDKENSCTNSNNNVDEKEAEEVQEWVPVNINDILNNSSPVPEESSQVCTTNSDVQIPLLIPKIELQSPNNLIDDQETVTDSSYNDNFHSTTTCDERYNEETSLFVELCDRINDIQLPEGWCTHVRRGDYVSFYEFDVRRSTESGDDSYNSFIKRSIIIRNNLNVNFTALGKNVKPEQISLPSSITDFCMLNNLVVKYCKLDFCCGIGDLDGVNLVQDTIGYTDILDQLRHNKCAIFSDGFRCKVCKNVTKTIRQKKFRMSQRGTGTRKTNSNECDSKSKLSLWKKKVKAQRQVIKRTKDKTNCLQNEVEKLKIEKTELTDFESYWW